MRKRVFVLIGIVLCMGLLPFFSAAADGAEADYTDVVILSTTDMHGKCWDTNVLTGAAERQNLLRISTAVCQFRETYGEDHVILIDNGDLYQGTAVSEHQLTERDAGQTSGPPVMAVCLKEMRYTACVLGNHEFNFAWDVMRETYAWLEENGIPVLAANICCDGTLEGTQAGEAAFTPYIIRTVTVNGHEHRIGILGLDNCDISRWDLPANYPGLRFVHPENDSFSMAYEADLFIPRMKAEGCEFIVVSYHGGMGETEGDLVFGRNTENQGMRLIAESHDIDLLINGHDHVTGYSNSTFPNADGREITVVNGGGQELTHTVFRFTENEEGALVWEMLETGNLDPGAFEIDAALQEMVRPCAETAERYLEEPVGFAVGAWDESRNFYTEQTDTADLICRACMEMTTLSLAGIAEELGAEAVMSAAGTDHLDVDVAMISLSVAGGYAVSPGPISIKDVYKLCHYADSVYILPMTGRQILAVMEENASSHLNARVHDGDAYFYSRGDQFTAIAFGGMNFVYDMAKPAGQRVTVEGLADGRAFDKDEVYLAAVTSYILGNENCGLRGFTADDALLHQRTDESGETIQDLIAGFVQKQTERYGGVSPEAFNWHWQMICSDTHEGLSPDDGEIGARLVRMPEDGKTYIIFNEAEEWALTAHMTGGGLGPADWAACGEFLPAPIPAEAAVFTAHASENGCFRFSDAEGRWLVSAGSGRLTLQAEPEDESMCIWTLEPAYGGWHIIHSDAAGKHAIQAFSGRFITYYPGQSGMFAFNFYEVSAN